MKMALGAFLLIVLLACNTHNILVIQSPLPEIAQYVEEFNEYTYRKFPQRNIIAVHRKEEFSRESPRHKKESDLIIAPFLAAEERVAEFANLSRLLSSSFFSRPFYRDFLKKGEFRNSQYFLPLSFDLPLLLSRAETEPSIPSYWIDFPELFRYTTLFSEEGADGKLTQAGMLYSNDILIPTLSHLGVSFQKDPENFMAWEEEHLESTLRILQDWIHQMGGEKLYSFEENHKLESLLTLLTQTQFAYVRASDFFSLSHNLQRPLMFRWYMHEETVQVLEEEIYVGLLQSSKQRSVARIFLEWLFSESTQEYLLGIETNTFGIVRGFSSLRSISELQIPYAYPSLIGHFPLESQLFFPPSRPAHWQEYQRNILQTWLEQRMIGQEEISLREKTNQWYAQIIPY